MAVRPELASAALVRKAIAADLEREHVTRATADDVVLVMSELVGNAVVHGGRPAGVAVCWDVEDGTVLLQVEDGSAEVPNPRTATTSENSGRGLAIVAALADDWGMRPTANGKQVWARVPVTRTA